MKKKILVVLPSPLMARNFLRSDALRLLVNENNAEVLVISPNPADRGTVEAEGAAWQPYFHPRRTITGTGTIESLRRWWRYARYLMGLALHMSLTYRFNISSGFRGFDGRLKQTFAVRRIYLREGLPMSGVFGFPLPRSRRIYNTFKRLYYSAWQSFGPVNRAIAEFAPDMMLLSMIQTHMVTPYALGAARQRIPILGMVGSWDQPSTKGPVVPNLSAILVQNELVRDELVRYHGISDDRITVIGWLQMDAYAELPTTDNSNVHEGVELPSNCRYMLFAANAPRLGPHEPELVRELARHIRENTFGKDVVLLCRCHPQDTAWEARWGWAKGMDRVFLQPPELGRLDRLAALIKKASVVVASAGSINLDAVALDVPTIGIAWENEELPFWDRPARAYDLEHLADLRMSKGMRFATDMPGLIAACRLYLADKSLDAEARAELRKRYLFKLDGKAARRLSDVVGKILP